MKHILATQELGNTTCYPCFQADINLRVPASVVVEELLTSEDELLPEDRTVYGLCATHADEQLVP